MNKKRVRKYAMTLLEIMIVIFIIGIISTVIGVNMKGSLEEAKAFKTKEGIKRIKEIFELELANGSSVEWILEDPKRALINSGLVSNPKEMLKDGWNVAYEFESIDQDADIYISSKTYDKYLAKKAAKRKEASKDEE